MLPKSHRVIGLSEITNKDQGLDEKTGHLLELLKIGHPTSDGFVITPKAFFEFLEANNLKAKINHLLETANFEDLDSVLKVSKYIKKHIVEGDIPENLTKGIRDSYRKFQGVLSDSTVTVRLPGKVIKENKATGDASLLQKIKEAWAIIFDHDDLTHRHKKKLNHFGTNPILIIEKS